MANVNNRNGWASVMISTALVVWVSPSYGGGDLRLSLVSGIDRIALLEALPLSVRFANDGGDDFTYSPMLFQDASSPGSPAGLRIVRPDGSVIKLRNPVYKPPYDGEPLPPLILRAGEQEVRDFALSCQWGAFEPVFAAVGEYRLTAYYEGEGRHAESNEIRVLVTPPPRSETDALRMLRDSRVRCALYAPEWIFSRHEGTREGPTRSLEELATLNGSRLYASYARLALGKGYLMLSEGERDPARRLAHLETAERWLNMIDTAGFTLAREVAAAREALQASRRKTSANK